ncbi:MAG TPA: carboxypeptidase-like regulatory domain-containing protein [Thermoanaerobaculia bacterium]|nr:carboxypeptidase-like regulatory domain-containing protein [Thermoanaerobaculia bacterium]
MLAFAAAAAGAAPVTVHTTAVDPRLQCDGEIVARAECGGADCATSRWRLGPTHTVDLDRSQPFDWIIGVESKNCWAPPVRLTTAAPSPSVDVTLWPRATIAGTVSVQGDLAPRLLRARLTLPPGRDTSLDTVIPCPVERGRWTCSVPATEIDIRLDADGFVPSYLWNVRAQHGKVTTLPATRLIRGASISGWVEVPHGDGKAAEVELLPIGAAPEIPVAHGDAPRSSITIANDRGFFQFPEVPPGSYSLIARKRGWSPAREPNVEIETGREYVLRAPLRLQPLASLSVTLQPPVGPDKSPWRVTLSRPAPLSRSFAVVRQEQAAESGYWTGMDLEADFYRLTVTDSRGSVFARREITLTAPGLSEVITIEKVAVAGRVTAGQNAIEARLAFIDGSLRVEMESGADGTFSGVLPQGGRWNLDVRPAGGANIHYGPIEIAASDDGEPAGVEIELPGGRARGLVLDESGRPLQATVRIRAGATVKAYGPTDAGGKFDFVALTPGPAQVEADAEDYGSALVPWTIAEEQTEDLRIVVPKRQAIAIRLVTPDGRAVSGAVVWQFLPPFRRRMEAVSGPDGTVRLQVPGSGSIDAAVFAAGLPLKLLSLPLDAKSGVVVTMNPTGGRLRFDIGDQAWPYIARSDGPFFPVAGLFFRPDPVGLPYGFTSAGFAPELEAGTYVICPGASLSERCQRRLLSPGTLTSVNLRPASGGSP